MERRWGNVYLTRQEVYDLVWSKPGIEVAAEFGCSDVAVAKLCKRLDVPRPPRGHWAKLASGKSVSVIQLHEPKLGTPQKGSLPDRPAKLAPEVTNPIAIAFANQKGASPIKVAATLSDPEPFTVAIRDALESARESSDGYLSPRRRNLPKIKLTLQTKDRGLLILDALLKAIQDRSMTVSMSDVFTVVTPTGAVDFTIEEEKIRVEREPTAREAQEEARVAAYKIRWGGGAPEPLKYYHDILPGRMVLRITTDKITQDRRKWTDSASRPLEKQLSSFIVGIVRFAENQVTEAKRIEEAARRREDAHRKWEAEQAKIRREQRRQEHLWKLIETWEKSQRIRSFSSALQLAQVERPSLPDEVLKETVRWMNAYADQFDPLTRTSGTDLRTIESGMYGGEDLSKWHV